MRLNENLPPYPPSVSQPKARSTAGSISRRGLLSGAIAGVAGIGAMSALSGCSKKTASNDPVVAKPSPEPTPSAAPQERFAGDTGPGQLLLGVSLAIDELATDRQDIGGNDITMSRRFYRDHQLKLMQRMVTTDAELGIVPFVSLKPPVPWRGVAEGHADWWLDSVVAKLGSLPVPAMVSLHHEPENDHSGGGNTPATWIAMHQRLAKFAESAPTITVVPVLMQWTFDPASKRDPQEWLIPELPVLGVDVYNPWRSDGRGSWVEFDTLMGQIRQVAPRVPIIVPEFGCAADPDDPSRASLWLRAAYESALRHNVTGLAWFDSVYNNEKGDIQLDKDGLTVMRELLGRPETVRWDAPKVPS